MKDLQKYTQDCLKELGDLGINCGTILNVIVNYRSKSHWGLCRYKRDLGGFIIEISNRLIADEVSDVALKNTLIHELLHTVKGTTGHTGLWKELADKVNNVYGYNIKRTTSEEEKGLEELPREQKEPSYVISCPKCGWKEGYVRFTKVVEFTDRYRCGHCKTSLIRLK